MERGKGEVITVPGTLKIDAYPTSLLLKHSQMRQPYSFYQSSDDRDMSSDRSVSERERNYTVLEGGCSDCTEVNNAIDEQNNGIQTDALIKAYNKQANYSTKQSLRKLFSHLANNLSQINLLRILQLLAFALLAYSVAAFYFWVEREDPSNRLDGLFQLKSGHPAPANSAGE